MAHPPKTNKPLSEDVVMILDALPHPAIALSTDYRILAANRAYRDLYSFAQGPIQKRCYQVSHGYSVPCDKAGESCPLKDSLDSGENTQVLHIHHTPRGEEYVNVEMWPVKDPETGHVRYFIEQIHPSTAGSTRSAPDRLVGRSAIFREMLELIERSAPSNATVMLLGESGTGKELVAQTIHRLSHRNSQPFVPVECTGLPQSLFESELFGYVKGAFTGASTNKTGLVAAAQGGTLFLDEVGDIPLSEQVKLLRLLETRRYRPVGSSDQQEADFRLICATNKDLHAMMQSGLFREDLYYRLRVFDITLPALRAREGDLELLIDTLKARLGITDISFDKEALNCLKTYAFPGNIRELRNIIERASLLTTDGKVGLRHLPEQCTAHPAPRRDNNRTEHAAIMTLQAAEQQYLQQAINTNQGDRKQLAKQLGISERVLYRKLAELRSS
jgi:transcriptional regulator with PAS, ATPase and Fis domain